MSTNKDYCYIINLNSVFGHCVPYPWNGVSFNVYTGTKYAVTATTKVLRNELAILKKDNIRIAVSFFQSSCFDF